MIVRHKIRLGVIVRAHQAALQIVLISHSVGTMIVVRQVDFAAQAVKASVTETFAIDRIVLALAFDARQCRFVARLAQRTRPMPEALCTIGAVGIRLAALWKEFAGLVVKRIATDDAVHTLVRQVQLVVSPSLVTMTRTLRRNQRSVLADQTAIIAR